MQPSEIAKMTRFSAVVSRYFLLASSVARSEDYKMNSLSVYKPQCGSLSVTGQFTQHIGAIYLIICYTRENK